MEVKHLPSRPTWNLTEGPGRLPFIFGPTAHFPTGMEVDDRRDKFERQRLSIWGSPLSISMIVGKREVANWIWELEPQKWQLDMNHVNDIFGRVRDPFSFAPNLEKVSLGAY